LAAEVRRILAWNHRGLVAVTRTYGTIGGASADGGPFENLLLSVFLTAGDCITHYDTFDVTDTDRALAHFTERSGEAHPS
jgi:hypothetical protein